MLLFCLIQPTNWRGSGSVCRAVVCVCVCCMLTSLFVLHNKFSTRPQCLLTVCQVEPTPSSKTLQPSKDAIYTMYMYTAILSSTRSHYHIHRSTHTHTHTHARTHARTHAHTHTHTHMYIPPPPPPTHTHTHTHTSDAVSCLSV